MATKTYMSKLFFTSIISLAIFQAAATSRSGRMAYGQCKCLPSQSLTVRFSYYSSGFGRLDTNDGGSLYLIINGNGKAQAVLYDPPSVVTSTRRGELTTEEVGQLSERLRDALHTAASHKIDETIIREGDSFSLAVTCGATRAGELEGRVEDWPESVKALLRDLRDLSKKLDSYSPPYGYIRAVRIEKNRLGSILKEGQVAFKSIQDYPPALRPIIAKAVDSPLDFHDVSRKELDELLKLPLTITHNGSSYELLPFLSKAPPNPNK